MTALDPGSVRVLTLAVHGDAVLTNALNHAIRRDLDRMIRVLVDPVTAVRRDALIEHTCFVLDQVREHHRVLDDVSWPNVLTARPELAGVASRVALAHGELIEPLRIARKYSLGWRDDPLRRLDLLSVVREVAAVLAPVMDQDVELAPLIDEVLGAEPAGPSAGVRTWVVAPTRLAKRTFWLLDDLDAERADLLTERTPRALMWILRNGFSGAYNRSSYLMWTGGGTGPAV